MKTQRHQSSTTATSTTSGKIQVVFSVAEMILDRSTDQNTTSETFGEPPLEGVPAQIWINILVNIRAFLYMML